MPLVQCNETVLDDDKNQELTEFQNGLDESQYCAHDSSGRKDSCPGGIGGPLQTPQTHVGPTKVVGVGSLGFKCSGYTPVNRPGNRSCIMNPTTG